MHPAQDRIHATLAKYALTCPDEVSDLFGRQGRDWIRQHLGALPPHTAYATGRLLDQVEALEHEVDQFEARMRAVFQRTPDIELYQDAARLRALQPPQEIEAGRRTTRLWDLPGLESFSTLHRRMRVV